MEIPASHLRHSRGPRARSARSGAPWVRKFGGLPSREILIITDRTPDRPSVHTTGIPM